MNRMKWSLYLLCVLIVASFVSVVSAQTEERQTGLIDDETPFAEIQFDVPQNGSLITIELDAINGDLDTLLYLVDRDGNILAENDDRIAGQDTNSTIKFPEADAGRYLIIATRYGVVDGTSSGEYELVIQVSPESELITFNYDVSDEALLTAGYPEMEARSQASWTIIAYYGGDNNLESGLEVDFKEFEAGGGSDESLNVVLFFDRSPEFSTDNGDWSGARVFEVTADTTGLGVTEPPTLNSEPLADLGNINSGDGQTFAQFLVWTLKHYPAENYIITFGSHGAAWEGVSRDDSEGEDLISLPEMREALRLAREQAGVEKFDLVINDACLMASIEYFDVVAEYFSYALASPEIVVNPAHDMTILLNAIRAQQDAPVPAYVDPMVDKYINQDILLRPGSDVAFLTSTFINLEAYLDVETAIDNFANVIKTSPAVYSTLLGRARSNAYVYSGFLGDDALIDLGALMRQIIFLANPATNAELIEVSQGVLNALQNSVLYGRGGRQVETQTSTYQSIYFPSSSQKFDADYLTETYLTGWGSMLRSYYNAVTPQVWSLGESVYRFHPPVAPKVTITNIYPTNELSNVNPLSITQQIVGRNIAYTNFTVDQVQDDGTIIRLLSQRILTPKEVNGVVQRVNEWDSGVDISEIVFDTSIPAVTDGTNNYYELVNITENVSSLEGRYREVGSDTWNTVSLVFSIPPEGESAQIQRVVNRSTDSSAVAVVTIPAGAEFQTFRYVVTPDGRVVTQLGNTYIWPEDGLKWSWEPAPTGDYNLGLLVTTYGGTTGFNSVSVSINNDNSTPDLRSNIRGTLGFSWVRPKTWLPAVVLFADSGFSFLRTSNPDESSNFSVYIARTRQGLTEDLQNISEIVQRDYGLTLVGDYRPMTIDGRDVLEFDYTYSNDEGDFVGRGFAHYVPEIPYGIVFTTESRGGSPDDFEELFAIMQDNLALFDPISEITDWYFDGGDYTTYPVLNSWGMAELVEGDVWWRYSENADPTNSTFWASGEFALETTDYNVALDELLPLITDGTEAFSEIDRRDYSGQYHTWRAVLYELTRNSETVRGRLYVTYFNDRFYAMWMETPEGENAEAIYTGILEPMVDGMTIDIIEEEIAEADTQEVSITATDNLEPAILLRYDGRALLLYNRLPSASVDISGLRFVQTPLAGSQLIFSAIDWEYGDKTDVGPAACYHVWAFGYINLPLGEYPVEICQTRQAFRQTRNPFWINIDPATKFQVYNGESLIATCDTVPPIAPEDYFTAPENHVEATCIIDLTP